MYIYAFQAATGQTARHRRSISTSLTFHIIELAQVGSDAGRN